MNFKIASVDSLVIEFDTTISLKSSQKIKYYYECVKKLEGIVDLIPSYTTLYITYDIFNTSYEELVSKIKAIKYTQQLNVSSSVLHEIPVYYATEVGPDLQRISEAKNISIEEIITLHTSKDYNVFAIGFAPGFAYLGEVDEKIAMGRLQSPRKMIAQGSVAIADTQTAIYPQNSPGGWNIIGNTPFKMFDKSLKTLCPVNMGDRIKFKSISKEEFEALKGQL